MDKYKPPILRKIGEGITVSTATVFSYHAHMHSYYEMTLYDRFDGTVTINDKAFTIDSPTAVLVIPSDFHRIDAPEGAEGRFIKIAFEADPSPGGEGIASSLILQGLTEGDFLYRLFCEIAEAAENAAYKTALVHTALLSLSGKGVRVAPRGNVGGSELAKRALQIVNQRFGESISLPLLAKELFVSPQYLSAVFKKNVGIPFVEHLTNVRLRRAAMLLLETKDSITHVSEACGYGNLSHFLRCFKRFYGVSPSVYRRNNVKIT